MAKTKVKWYNERTWAAVLCIAAILLAYAMASHSLDTGSWQQYGITFALLVFAINRGVRAIVPGKKHV